MKPYFNKMLRELVRVANRHEALMDGTIAPVKRIVDNADVVWAVFNDPDEVGVGTLIIKGSSALDEAAAGRWPTELRCTAIKTIDRNMAIVAREVLGDGAGALDVAISEVLN